MHEDTSRWPVQQAGSVYFTVCKVGQWGSARGIREDRLLNYPTRFRVRCAVRRTDAVLCTPSRSAMHVTMYREHIKKRGTFYRHRSPVVQPVQPLGPRPAAL